MEEKIKEEDAAEGKETVSVKQGKKSRVGKLIAEMWPAYLIEVVVIIAGILITLALEEWRDKHKEAELETIYLKNLLGDIESDRHGLSYSVEGTGTILLKGNELLTFIGAPSQKPFSPLQVESDLRTILERPNFISNDATFSDLKSSGNLHLLKDIRLKSLLFSYYSLTAGIQQIQAAEQQATINISGPYFFKRFQLSNAGNKELSIDSKTLQVLAREPEFGNNVALRVDNRTELLANYKKADSLAVRIKSLLSTEP